MIFPFKHALLQLLQGIYVILWKKFTLILQVSLKLICHINLFSYMELCKIKWTHSLLPIRIQKISPPLQH